MLELSINQKAQSSRGIDNLLDLVELAKAIYDKVQIRRAKFNLWQAVKTVPLLLEVVTELEDVRTTIDEVKDLDAVEMEQLLNRVSTLWDVDLNEAKAIADAVVFPLLNGLVNLGVGVSNALTLKKEK